MKHCKIFYIKVNEGEVYSISRQQALTNRFRVAFSVDRPGDGVAYTGEINADTDMEILNIVIPAGVNYLIVFLSDGEEDVLQKIKDSLIQVERGETATAYEEPVTGSTELPDIKEEVEDMRDQRAIDYTVIDEGEVLTGTLLIGNESRGVISGLTGQGGSGASVVIWSGKDFDNRGTAPFRVLANGKVYMANAIISGNSQIAGFKIVGDAIENFNDDASLIFRYVGGQTPGGGTPINSIYLNRPGSPTLVDIETRLLGKDYALRLAGGDRSTLRIEGHNGMAMYISGGVNIEQKEVGSRYWNAPGVLAGGWITGNVTLAQTWHIDSISLQISDRGGNVTRITHNLGHTDYGVMPSTSNRNADILPVTRTAHYFEIENKLGNNGCWFIMFGRNTGMI